MASRPRRCRADRAVAELDDAIDDMAARLQRLEAALANRAHKDRREGDAEYEIGSLIG